jgi:23S rRNA (uracil1939-C5)-methyltransferase
MVVVVTGQEMFPGSNEFCKRIRNIDPNIKTIIQNINSRKTSVVLGDKEKVLFGPGQISDYLFNLRFNITSKSFFQVNPLQAEKLYQRVKDYANFKGNEIIIDAYSGVGTIGMFLSDKVNKVISVENNKQAHLAAITNAKNNKIKNVLFYNADATEFIYQLAKQREKIDVVVMDPPRTGSTEQFIDSCIKLNPKKIVYVSCGPDTLARDLQLFYKNKYFITKGSCFDMFCFSEHVETVVLLEKNNIKK